MARKPPDILITTPESLFLILTSQAREMLRTVETLILDEVHAVAGTKRGAHLALTVERLDQLLPSPGAADRPLRDAAAHGGDRPLRLRWPSDRARRRGAREGARPRGRRAGGGHARAAVQQRALVSRARGRAGDGRGHRARRSVDLAVDLPRDPPARRAAPLDDRLRQQPPPGRAARAAAERAGRARAGARAPRLARPRAAGRGGGAAEEGRDPVPRRHLVARAGHRHGRRRPRDPGGVAEVRRARAAARRPGRARARGRLQGPHLPEVPRGPARVGGRRPPHARRRDRGDRHPAQPARRARPADRGDLRRGRGGRGRPPRARPRRLSLLGPLARPARERPRHARRGATRPTSSPSCGLASPGTARAGRSAASPAHGGWR